MTQTTETETRLGKNGLFLNNGNEYKPLLVAKSADSAEKLLLQSDLWPLVLKRCQELTGKHKLTNQEIKKCFYAETGFYITSSFFLRMKKSHTGVKHTYAMQLAKFLGISYEEIKKPSNEYSRESKDNGGIFQTAVLFFGIQRNHSGVGCYRD